MIKASQHNLTVIRKGIKALIPRTGEKYIQTIFSEVAESVFDWIDTQSKYYENDTYNLRDSIGLGAFKQGVLQQWIITPESVATRDRHFKYGDTVMDVNGRQMLMSAIQSGDSAKFSLYSLVLYAAAPYGVLVEDGNGKRGTGWWSEGLVPHTKSAFLAAISKYNAK